jgi:hypothetical protein
VQSNLDYAGRGAVIECQNDLGIADDQQTKLTVNGIAAVDWGTGWNWDWTAVDSKKQDAVKTAFRLMQRLDAHGGYGVIYTDSFSDVAIGRATPGCIYYDKIRVDAGNENLEKFKIIHFDEWAVMEGEEFREDFSAVHQAFLNKNGSLHPSHIKTMETIDDTNAVTEAFAQLDLGGRPQRRM